MHKELITMNVLKRLAVLRIIIVGDQLLHFQFSQDTNYHVFCLIIQLHFRIAGCQAT
jgi:hypothetical protein